MFKAKVRFSGPGVLAVAVAKGGAVILTAEGPAVNPKELNTQSRKVILTFEIFLLADIK